MQAHVKTPHIKIDIEGDIPSKLINLLKKEYGNNVKFIQDDKDEYVDIKTTAWYKKMKKNMTPGDHMKVYREVHKMTQLELGKKMGNTPRQHISNMEHGSRKINIETAKKLSKIFDVPVDRFL